MGCFSYLCNICGEPILSDSFNGELVVLFRVRDGVLVEAMAGPYDSYGRCFKEDLLESYQWIEEWNKMCNVHLDPTTTDGEVAVHQRCLLRYFPFISSDRDPEQGWGYNNKYPRGSEKKYGKDREIFGNRRT